KIHSRLAARTPAPTPSNRPSPAPAFLAGRPPALGPALRVLATTAESDVIASASSRWPLRGDAKSTAEESSPLALSSRVIWSEEGSPDPISDPGPPRRRDELGLSSCFSLGRLISIEEPLFF